MAAELRVFIFRPGRVTVHWSPSEGCEQMIPDIAGVIGPTWRHDFSTFGSGAGPAVRKFIEMVDGKVFILEGGCQIEVDAELDDMNPMVVLVTCIRYKGLARDEVVQAGRLRTGSVYTEIRRRWESGDELLPEKRKSGEEELIL